MTTRLQSYHKALSDLLWERDLMPLATKAANVFTTEADRKAAEAITEAHRRRLRGEGSPADCDDVARRVAG